MQMFSLQHVRQVSLDVYSIHITSALETKVYMVTFSKVPFPHISTPPSLAGLIRSHPHSLKVISQCVTAVSEGKELELPTELFTSDTATETKPLIAPPGPLPLSVGRPEVEWVLPHLGEEVGNTLLPCAFEHEIIAQFSEDFSRLVGQLDVRKNEGGEVRRIVAPKASVGVRTATQLDPLDAITLTSLGLMMGERIEKARASIGSGIVHSFRFSPAKNRLWSRDIGWASFSKAGMNLAETYSHVLQADISSFYHAIHIGMLEQQLCNIGVRRRLAAAACRILRMIAEGEKGLPVGPSISALFAETVLVYVDEALLAAGVCYIRFNDDFRIFANSEKEELRSMRVLESVLADIGLSLNPRKTKMLSASEYSKATPAHTEWWLQKMRSKSFQDETDLRQKKLIESAKSVLIKMLTTPHGENVAKLTRAAFRALPGSARSEVLPEVMAWMHRAAPMSSDLALAVRNPYVFEGMSHEVASSNFIQAVLTQMMPEKHKLTDYSLLWILDAFRRSGWKEPSLSKLFRAITHDSTVWREIALASGSGPSPYHQSAWSERGLQLLSGKATERTSAKKLYRSDFDSLLRDKIFEVI